MSGCDSGMVLQVVPWGLRASVEDRCLHRYQVALGTEGEGARGQNRPLLQNEKQWVRKMLSAAVSQMDLNRAGMLEKVLRWLSLTPMTDTSRHRLGSGISKDWPSAPSL